MKAMLFPGQGSQKVGMGADLFEHFKGYVDQANDILGYSIQELCLNDPRGELVQTNFTQPALYTVNALSYMKAMQEESKPDYVAGHSLGEYNALFAAEVFDFATGLKLVKKRGELMANATGGGMAAVIGLSYEEIDKILTDNKVTSIDIANLNSPGQIVISGPKEDVLAAQPAFEKHAKLYIPLNVGGAFHSRYMEESKKKYYDFLREFKFSSPIIPVISNVTARPYRSNDILSGLSEQITSSVNWIDSIRYLMGKDVSDFVEVGPGKTLTGMVAKIKAGSSPLVIEDEEELKKNRIEEKVEENNRVEEPERVDDAFWDSSYQLEEASNLGSAEFKEDYGLKYAYVTGGMFAGIASKELVVKASKAGILSFFGSAGLDVHTVRSAIDYMQSELGGSISYGVNLVHQPLSPDREMSMVELCLEKNIRNIEVSGFMSITPSLVLFRAKGLRRENGKVVSHTRVLAKISRPEVAGLFMSPAPEYVVGQMLEEGLLSREDADKLKEIPMADDICAEADSAGYTNQAVAFALIPSILKLKKEIKQKHGYHTNIRVGAAGGLGTPEAISASFVLGVDFVLTGSINQCTVESAMNDNVKDMLQHINVQDTDYAPAADMFELGEKVQVLKKGVFYPARAKKLYQLYINHNSWEDIDLSIRTQLEEKYFKLDFDSIYAQVTKYFATVRPVEIEKAEKNPKHKLALVFRWYLRVTSEYAQKGNMSEKVNFQVHCGSALGAFNQWVKGTELESWKNRHVDQIGIKLMLEAEKHLTSWNKNLMNSP